jgi:mercuric ion transport protein
MADRMRVSARRGTIRETGSLLLAASGLAAAFGAASCCALPMLLASLGMGSAWLLGIALLAAPHRIALLTATVVCLVGAGTVLIWHRRAIACAKGSVCGHRAVTPLVASFLSLATALAIAGYLFA